MLCLWHTGQNSAKQTISRNVTDSPEAAKVGYPLSAILLKRVTWKSWSTKPWWMAEANIYGLNLVMTTVLQLRTYEEEVVKVLNWWIQWNKEKWIQCRWKKKSKVVAELKELLKGALIYKTEGMLGSACTCLFMNEIVRIFG